VSDRRGLLHGVAGEGCAGRLRRGRDGDLGSPTPGRAASSINDEVVDPLLIEFDNPYLGGLYIGNVDVGAKGHGDLSLTNLGASSLSITSAVIGGADASDFSIAVPQDDTCSGTSLAVGASCSIRVSLIPTEERGFKLAVELNVTLPQVQDPEQAVQIVAAAHRVCPYSNATRGNIDVTLTANGHDVG